MKKSTYVCSQCGYEMAGYMGRCPECNSWNTMVEKAIETKRPVELNHYHLRRILRGY